MRIGSLLYELRWRLAIRLLPHRLQVDLLPGTETGDILDVYDPDNMRGWCFAVVQWKRMDVFTDKAFRQRALFSRCNREDALIYRHDVEKLPENTGGLGHTRSQF